MKPEFKKHLQKTLGELDSLLKQIHETKSYTESNEYVACLRELISEQLEGQTSEDTNHATDQVR